MQINLLIVVRIQMDKIRQRQQQILRKARRQGAFERDRYRDILAILQLQLIVFPSNIWCIGMAEIKLAILLVPINSLKVQEPGQKLHLSMQGHDPSHDQLIVR